MKTAFCVQVAGIFLFALLTVPLSWAHDSCSYCHINAAPVAGNAGLLSQLPELCINCHPDRIGNAEHVIGVKPVLSMTTPLPLLNGRLTCITCHDSHSDVSTLLRMDKALLCRTCHQDK
ncbi:cytochrome c3 family protein [Kaarinaea lacus]